MWSSALVFLFGLFVFTIVTMGMLLFYLPAYQEEAARNGTELPAAARWCARLVGLEVPAQVVEPPRR